MDDLPDLMADHIARKVVDAMGWHNDPFGVQPEKFYAYTNQNTTMDVPTLEQMSRLAREWEQRNTKFRRGVLANLEVYLFGNNKILSRDEGEAAK